MLLVDNNPVQLFIGIVLVLISIIVYVSHKEGLEIPFLRIKGLAVLGDWSFGIFCLILFLVGLFWILKSVL